MLGEWTRTEIPAESLVRPPTSQRCWRTTGGGSGSHGRQGRFEGNRINEQGPGATAVGGGTRALSPNLAYFLLALPKKNPTITVIRGMSLSRAYELNVPSESITPLRSATTD